MKNLRYLTIVIVVLLHGCAYGQINNMLTSAERDSIKVNGINWSQINSTKGDTTQMKLIFGDSTQFESESVPHPMISFWDNSKGFYFRFEKNGPNPTDDYTLYDFSISNANANLTIKGTTLTIGSNISLLGNVNIDYTAKQIVFVTNDTSDMLILKFNDATSKIIDINFVTLY